MDERQYRNGGWRRLKIFAGLVVMAFAATLAVVVGNRLSDEALAVLAGAVCGVSLWRQPVLAVLFVVWPLALIAHALILRRPPRRADRGTSLPGTARPPSARQAAMQVASSRCGSPQKFPRRASRAARLLGYSRITLSRSSRALRAWPSFAYERAMSSSTSGR